jgi:uncharacterized membrane protein YoaK (UPF0700 family)
MTSHPKSPWTFLNEPSAIVLLAALGGYIDAAGYLAFFGLFTSSITGNLVAAAAGASLGTSESVLSRTCVLLVFLGSAAAGVCLTNILKRTRGWDARESARLMFILELFCFVPLWVIGAITVGSGGPGLPDQNSSQVLLLSSLCAMSMAFQCCAVKVCAPTYPATNVITSSLVNTGAAFSALVVLTSEVAYRKLFHVDMADFPKQLHVSWNAFVKTTLPIIGFTIGAFVGAVLYDVASFHCVAIPCAIVIVFVVDLSLLVPSAARQPVTGALSVLNTTSLDKASQQESSSAQLTGGTTLPERVRLASQQSQSPLMARPTDESARSGGMLPRTANSKDADLVVVGTPLWNL